MTVRPAATGTATTSDSTGIEVAAEAAPAPPTRNVTPPMLMPMPPGMAAGSGLTGRAVTVPGPIAVLVVPRLLPGTGVTVATPPATTPVSPVSGQGWRS